MLPFDDFPLYATLHELCYLQGAASEWSADRIMRTIPEYLHSDPDSDGPIYFFGEMCFKAMYNDYMELRDLKDTAEILAYIDDWPDLYNSEQLAKNEVPVYSATFVDDMYVSFDLARETATKIKGCKNFITNVLYHDGLSKKSDEVVKQLFALRDDVLD
ncbi:hypothetical protein G7Y79_00015g038310 [Physcia stellaris]|nr:hypothetical protein G7Y79_00015g038310 [Physcia stellaris]